MLRLTLELVDFSLALLVLVDLGLCSTGLLVKGSNELIKLAAEIAALLLDLGAVLALVLKFLLKLLDAALEVLDLLLQLSYKVLLILKLAVQSVDLSILPVLG